ncbi:MarR family winged helix-turn-helix transcriptional regulator [Thalassospira sp. GB04J01]|jgi:DNA-binding MarR family transcriptional regulator|uniref:MarR family winged helix-turn-helix transcriptional regulator n=1 Tax=Thalassospira TaxID=168934 RepID=UPI000C9A46F2|nr:MarR family transcriptional regulator [Thalassospira sp. GB04J01]|tara:strand:+ start:131383 stop:131862 length:480 start_codon:yes stop_codon:yes gene_type:complete
MSEAYWQDILVALRQIIRATDLHSKRMMKNCGLTIPQVMVLRAIDELQNVTVKRISNHVSLSQATVTTILNRLEQRNLAERRRSTTDKRVVNTVLTDAGREILSTAPTMLHEEFISQFESLPDWEKTQLLTSMQRVAFMMDAEKIDAAPILDLRSDPTR